MKRSTLLIAGIGLLHLIIIDLTFYVITTGAPEKLLILGGYNMVWLYIIGMIASQGLRARREN